MGVYRQELLYTVVLIGFVLMVVFFTRKAIRKFGLVKSIEVNRRKIIFYLSYLIIYILAGSILALIWGLDIKRFTVFISSVLAVLGVGFFAQWSILSNLTASVVLFLSHPLRIGDRIRVMDKDFDWVGEVKDITGFFLFMKTDDGKNITIPTSLIMQKGIEIFDKIDLEDEENYD